MGVTSFLAYMCVLFFFDILESEIKYGLLESETIKL